MNHVAIMDSKVCMYNVCMYINYVLLIPDSFVSYTAINLNPQSVALNVDYKRKV